MSIIKAINDAIIILSGYLNCYNIGYKTTNTNTINNGR